jgi:hypothetical protein
MSGLLGFEPLQIAPPDEGSVSDADAVADLYRKLTADAPAESIWSQSNPVGTETTRPAQELTMPSPDFVPGVPLGGGMVSQDFHDQWNQAMNLALGFAGTDGPGFSLEKVQRRRQAYVPNEHIWNIKDPAGAQAGTIDTTWNPETGNLHIEDFQSEGGPNTLGPTAIRQLRSALLEQYPGVQSLSGLRISGATYAHRNSGSGPGREAAQSVRSR